MKTIWVLENIRKDYDFYQRFNILNLIASVSLWRKYHPEDHTILYCDMPTYLLLNYLEVLDLWHDVNTDVLEQDSKIDKTVFWAGSKLEVLQTLEEPVTIVDNDWLAFQSMDEVRTKSPLVYSHDENGVDYYLADHEWYLTELKKTPIVKELFPTTQEAINVCFLTFNDVELLKKYSNMSVQLMEEWTEMKIRDNRLIIYAEQKLLKQLVNKYKIESSPLIKESWLCKNDGWCSDINEKGEWSQEDIWRIFKHYGPTKRKFKDNEEGYNYEKEIRFLYNCIGAGKMVDVEKLKVNLKKAVQNV